MKKQNWDWTFTKEQRVQRDKEAEWMFRYIVAPFLIGMILIVLRFTL